MLAFILGDEVSLLDIVGQYWLICPIAFAVSLAATPICRQIAVRFGVLDRPDEDVKTHAAPTAYLGGVAILAGLLTGFLVGFLIMRAHEIQQIPIPSVPVQAFSGGTPSWLMLAGIGLGAAIACLVGLLDDIIDLRPWQKILGQVVAASVLVAIGVRPNLAHLCGYLGFDLPALWDLIIGIPIVLFFILGATNSLNLLDGLDGLCAGVTTIITLAFLCLAIVLATWGHSPVGDPVRLVVCLALVGAALGFLPMNRHPARIFMGDAGSMLLGYIAGTVMLLFTEQMGKWSVAAIVIFFLPILDTSVAIARRFINKKPLFRSDRGHIYDQLMDRRWSLTKTVKTCYLLAALYALIGLLISRTRFRYAGVAFVLVLIISAVIVWRKGFLQTHRRQD